MIPVFGQSRGLLEFCFIDVPHAEKTPHCQERVLSSQAERRMKAAAILLAKQLGTA